MGNLSFVESLKEAGVIKQNVFAIYLSENDSFFWKSLLNSSISFGSWDLSRYSKSDSFEFIPADLSDGRWAVDLTEPQMGNTLLGLGTRSAFLSTSFSFLFVPEQVYSQIRNLICSWTWCRSEVGIRWNCTSYSLYNINNLTFKLGTLRISIPAEYFITRSGDWCEVTLNTLNGADYWILGVEFMRKYYMLFDVEGERVGFAAAKQDMEFQWGAVGLIAVVVVLIGGIATCAGGGKAKRD